jgi:hypothetical protein
MIKLLGRRNKLVKMSSLQKPVLVNLQLKFQEEEELNSVTEDVVIKISQLIEDKVEDEFKEEEEAMIKEEEAVKEEETQIINEDQTTSEEVNQKDLKIVIINMAEVETSVKLCADDATNWSLCRILSHSN